MQPHSIFQDIDGKIPATEDGDPVGSWLLSRLAVFNPVRKHDLKPGAEKYIGKCFWWSPGWIIEDGEYAGQRSYMIDETGTHPFVWVPECDLEFMDLCK